MSFACPECVSGSLSILASIELPPDSRSDEITLQIVKCSRCGLSALAVYQESRRGSLDSESVDHRGYHVSADVLRRVRKMIDRCPHPRDHNCRCSSHRVLGSRNEYGRWDWLDDVEYEGTFFVIVR